MAKSNSDTNSVSTEKLMLLSLSDLSRLGHWLVLEYPKEMDWLTVLLIKFWEDVYMGNFPFPFLDKLFR